MPGIPQKTNDTTTPNQIVGERVGEVRRASKISQDGLANSMQSLGHPSWRRQTVGQIEQGQRNITVDELISLAETLEVPYQRLLDPRSFINNGLPEDPNIWLKSLGT